MRNDRVHFVNTVFVRSRLNRLQRHHKLRACRFHKEPSHTAPAAMPNTTRALPATSWLSSEYALQSRRSVVAKYMPSHTIMGSVYPRKNICESRGECCIECRSAAPQSQSVMIFAMSAPNTTTARSIEDGIIQYPAISVVTMNPVNPKRLNRSNNAGACQAHQCPAKSHPPSTKSGICTSMCHTMLCSMSGRKGGRESAAPPTITAADSHRRSWATLSGQGKFKRGARLCVVGDMDQPRLAVNDVQRGVVFKLAQRSRHHHDPKGVE